PPGPGHAGARPGWIPLLAPVPSPQTLPSTTSLLWFRAPAGARGLSRGGMVERSGVGVKAGRAMQIVADSLRESVSTPPSRLAERVGQTEHRELLILPHVQVLRHEVEARQLNQRMVQERDGLVGAQEVADVEPHHE